MKFTKDDIKAARLLSETIQLKSSEGKDPFWVVTLIRYMVCEWVCDKYGLDNFCFIEGDNLIYFPLDEAIWKYCDNSLAVCNQTVHGYYSSGTYLCSNVGLLRELNDFVFNEIKSGIRSLTDMNTIWRFHRATGKLTILPHLPQDTDGNLLFDPLSTG